VSEEPRLETRRRARKASSRQDQEERAGQEGQEKADDAERQERPGEHEQERLMPRGTSAGPGFVARVA
jgi:hypothetical protein